MSISQSANVSAQAQLDSSCKVWDHSQIRERVSISENCVIGRNVYIGPGVTIGVNCKIQNNALIYEPANIGDGVFIGPGVVFTNDLNPRATNANGKLKQGTDWTLSGVNVGDGASLGANVTCVAPVNIGSWSMVGAGSVVIENVPDYGLVVGNPARQVGWVGKSGFRLQDTDGILTHPKDPFSYRLGILGNLEIYNEEN
jgi:UDP-2-acetamido-3-amino-2,3-dideoxy-glucuronate N-acetyltransferase